MSNHHIHAAFTYMFDIGKSILFAGIDSATKVILCQTGSVTDSTVDSDKAELWGPPGLWSVPAPPTSGNSACQSVAIKHSDHDIIIATRDTRRSTIYGNLKAGETCVGANIGQARSLWKSVGTIDHITTSDNTAGGTTISEHLGPDGWMVTTPWGQIGINSSGFTVTVGGAAITLTPAGVAKLMGTQVAVQGSIAAISGTVATCLGPNATPNPAQGCAYSPVGPVNVISTNVFVSP